MSDSAKQDKSQLDKFKDAARELECDDDETRFADKLSNLAKHKPDRKKCD